MKVEGKRKYVRRAVFAACLLDVYDFNLQIIESDETSLAHDGASNFTLRIESGYSKVVLAEIIGHEMVHLAQYVRGDLVDSDEGVLWKGNLYLSPEYMSDDYFLSPWEMECRSLEAWIGYRWHTRSKNELH